MHIEQHHRTDTLKSQEYLRRSAEKTVAGGRAYDNRCNLSNRAYGLPDVETASTMNLDDWVSDVGMVSDTAHVSEHPAVQLAEGVAAAMMSRSATVLLPRMFCQRKGEPHRGVRLMLSLTKEKINPLVHSGGGTRTEDSCVAIGIASIDDVQTAGKIRDPWLRVFIEKVNVSDDIRYSVSLIEETLDMAKSLAHWHADAAEYRAVMSLVVCVHLMGFVHRAFIPSVHNYLITHVGELTGTMDENFRSVRVFGRRRETPITSGIRRTTPLSPVIAAPNREGVEYTEADVQYAQFRNGALYHTSSSVANVAAADLLIQLRDRTLPALMTGAIRNTYDGNWHIYSARLNNNIRDEMCAIMQGNGKLWIKQMLPGTVSEVLSDTRATSNGLVYTPVVSTLGRQPHMTDEKFSNYIRTARDVSRRVGVNREAGYIVPWMTGTLRHICGHNYRQDMQALNAIMRLDTYVVSHEFLTVTPNRNPYWEAQTQLKQGWVYYQGPIRHVQRGLFGTIIPDGLRVMPPEAALAKLILEKSRIDWFGTDKAATNWAESDMMNIWVDFEMYDVPRDKVVYKVPWAVGITMCLGQRAVMQGMFTQDMATARTNANALGAGNALSSFRNPDRDKEDTLREGITSNELDRAVDWVRAHYKLGTTIFLKGGTHDLAMIKGDRAKFKGVWLYKQTRMSNFDRVVDVGALLPKAPKGTIAEHNPRTELDYFMKQYGYVPDTVNEWSWEHYAPAGG